jgi:hypothetical protein
MKLSDLDILLPTRNPEPLVKPRWGTVTQTSPLRVRLDGDTTPLPLTPDSLERFLMPGERVRCEFTGKKLTVTGRLDGQADNPYLIPNNGFESGDLSGWDAVGGWYVNNTAPSSGIYKALTAVTSTSQYLTSKARVPTTANVQYTVEFTVYSDMTASDSFMWIGFLKSDGSASWQQVPSNNGGWARYRFTFLGGSSVTWISPRVAVFGGSTSPTGYVRVDDVSMWVEPTATLWNQNLNALLSPGLYYMSGVDATTANNAPWLNNGGWIEVFGIPSTGNKMMRFTDWSHTQVWVRYYGSGSWSVWRNNSPGGLSCTVRLAATINALTAASTWETVPLATQVENLAGNLFTVDGTGITVNVAGRYRVTAGCITPGNVTTRLLYAIFVSGGELARLTMAATSGGSSGTITTRTISLAAGTTITARAFSESTANGFTVNGSGTWLQVEAA